MTKANYEFEFLSICYSWNENYTGLIHGQESEEEGILNPITFVVDNSRALVLKALGYYVRTNCYYI